MSVFGRTATVTLIVFLVGAGVRALGLRHGEPDLIFHPDVAKQVLVARQAFDGNPDPRRLYGRDVERTLYPYGTAVLLGAGLRFLDAAGISSFVPRGPTAEAERWRWALRLRVLASAAFLIAVVAVLTALAPAMAPLPLATAGLLLVLEPLNAQLSHYGMNDVALTAALLGVWVLSIRTAQRKRIAWSAAAGGLLGIGFGIKYQALFGVLLWLPFWLVTWDRSRPALAHAGAFAAGFVAGALVTTPLLLIDPGYVLRELPAFLRWQANILGEEVAIATRVSRNALWLVETAGPTGLFLLGIGPAWASLRLLRTGDPVERAQIGSLLLFTLALGLVVVFFRDLGLRRRADLVPILPFWILLFALWFSSWRAPGRRLRRMASGALAGALVLTFANVSFRDALALAGDDTRVRAQRWCQANIPDGSRILRERYTLGLGRAAVAEREVRYLGAPDLQPAIESRSFDYLIASALAFDRFYDPTSPFYSPTFQQGYEAIQARFLPVATFSGRRLEFANPEITIYAPRPPS